MQILKDEGHTELEDAEPTIQFIGRFHALIKAMPSRTPETALRPQESCPQRMVLFYFMKI